MCFVLYAGHGACLFGEANARVRARASVSWPAWQRARPGRPRVGAVV